jgi:hypothetical protein
MYIGVQCISHSEYEQRLFVVYLSLVRYSIFGLLKHAHIKQILAGGGQFHWFPKNSTDNFHIPENLVLDIL